MNSKKIFLLLTFIICSFSVSADGGEPVNCRSEVVGNQAIYQGLAECDVFVDDGYSPFLERRTLSQYVPATTIRTINLIGIFYNNYYQCTAQVPFYGYAPITQEVCDYTPVASIGIFRDENSTDTGVFGRGSDQDGTVTMIELWIDGVKQSRNSATLKGRAGKKFIVKTKVHDDDGYSTESTKTVTLEFTGPGCGDSFC